MCKFFHRRLRTCIFTIQLLTCRCFHLQYALALYRVVDCRFLDVFNCFHLRLYPCSCSCANVVSHDDDDDVRRCILNMYMDWQPLFRKNPLHVISGTMMEHFSKSQLYKQTTPSISYWEWNKYNRQMQSPWAVAHLHKQLPYWWCRISQPSLENTMNPPEKFRALPSSSPWPLHTIPAWCTQR